MYLLPGDHQICELLSAAHSSRTEGKAASVLVSVVSTSLPIQNTTFLCVNTAQIQVPDLCGEPILLPCCFVMSAVCSAGPNADGTATAPIGSQLRALLIPHPPLP